MRVYLDASFLVSLYSVDANSVAAVRMLQGVDAMLLVSSLAELEVVNAFELRVFRKEITSFEAKTSLQSFGADLLTGVFQACAIPAASFARGRRVSQQSTARLGTRTSDLLHVATAIELKSEWFYSFDERQRRLAQAMKLKLNPLS